MSRTAEWKRSRITLGYCSGCFKHFAQFGKRLCERCLEKAAEKRINYTPLDQVLEEPAVRILRAVRHFDLITSNELLTILAVPDTAPGENLSDRIRERNAYARSLSRLVERGSVERMDIANSNRSVRGCGWTYYRITRAGLDELARRLTVDMEVEWAA